MISPLCCAQAASSNTNHSRNKGGSALWRPLASAASTPMQMMDKTPDPPETNKHPFSGSVQHNLGPSSNSSFAVVIPQQKQSQKQGMSQDCQNSSLDLCLDQNSQGGSLSGSEFTVMDSSQSRLSLSLTAPVEFLPRIAEEKDSPTNSGAVPIHEEKVDQKISESNHQVLFISQNVVTLKDNSSSLNFKKDNTTIGNSNKNISTALNAAQKSENFISTNKSCDNNCEKTSNPNTKSTSDVPHRTPFNVLGYVRELSKDFKDSVKYDHDSSKITIKNMSVIKSKSEEPESKNDLTTQLKKKAEDTPTITRSPSLVGQIASKLESLTLKSIQETTDRKSSKTPTETQKSFKVKDTSPSKVEKVSPSTKTEKPAVSASKTEKLSNLDNSKSTIVDNKSSKSNNSPPKVDIVKTDHVSVSSVANANKPSDGKDSLTRINTTVSANTSKSENVAANSLNQNTGSVKNISENKTETYVSNVNIKSTSQDKFNEANMKTKLEVSPQKKDKPSQPGKSESSSTSSDNSLKTGVFPIKFEGLSMRNPINKTSNTKDEDKKSSMSPNPLSESNKTSGKNETSTNVTSVDKKDNTCMKRSDSTNVDTCKLSDVSKAKEMSTKSSPDVSDQKAKKDSSGGTEKVKKKK